MGEHLQQLHEDRYKPRSDPLNFPQLHECKVVLSTRSKRMGEPQALHLTSLSPVFMNDSTARMKSFRSSVVNAIFVAPIFMATSPARTTIYQYP